MASGMPIQPLQLTLSRVDGVEGVTEVLVHADRIELIGAREPVMFEFQSLYCARTTWLERLRDVIRRWPRYIADRDWFHAPHERFFRLYTIPPVTVYMPPEPMDTAYDETVFVKFQSVVRSGGFDTWNLG
jgi:hypothetical protein